MATKLIAPRTGEGVEELTVTNWLKDVGDQVGEMESILEIETDKVVTEFPSPVAGTLLRIDVPAGSVVKVGESMGLVGKPGESPDETDQPTPVEEQPAQTEKPEEVQDETSSQPTTPTVEKPVQKSAFLSPLVRKMLDEHQLYPDLIEGTGSGGRITKQDVESYLENPKKVAQSATEPKAEAKEKPAQSSAAAPIAADIPGMLIPHTSTR